MILRTFATAVLVAFLAAPSFAQTLLIENVTLIDGRGGAPTPGASILIDDERIKAVSSDTIAVAEDVQRIKGAGKYLTPGFIDTHVHLRRETIDENNAGRAGRSALASFLYSGVTSIYDAGNRPDHILKLRDNERAGKIRSPRIFATGGIVTYPGSHGGGPGATLVDSWPEAIPEVDEHIAKKPDIVKFTLEERGWGARPLIPMLPVDLLQRLVEYYNDRGVRTTAHTSSELRARQAIFAGVDTLTHPVIQGPVSDAFPKLMAAKKIPMSTTLTIGENYARLAEHPEYLDQPLYRASLSVSEINHLKNIVAKEFSERSWTWWMKIMTPIAQENLRKIHDAGGILALGTDQTIGPAAHREMELLADAGIAPIDIITIATKNSALFIGIEDDLGTIEVGKLADMVLLDADPTIDINNAKKISAVIKNGAVVDFAELPLAGSQ
ncbi:MAG: amidohydrolase family protein [Marinicaulis sp.]|nr:amidohydrolase family protein [Marinicaulis sp.]NNL87566.1 amidohydrolase family protein [Marinicaulis sp.]